MRDLLQNTEKAVEQFRAAPAKTQVPLENLQTNPFRSAAVWIVFPAAFAAYSLVRGAIVDWYPYLFLDPTEHSYLGVTIGILVIGAGMLAMIWLLARSAGARHAHSSR